jgi:Tfp pilus assembly protein PilV
MEWHGLAVSCQKQATAGFRCGGFEVYPAGKNTCRERGTTLIEMMIALLVLVVGLLGPIALVSIAVSSNARSKRDSTSAALAEMVIGQISTIPVGGAVTAVTITDCAGNSTTVDVSGTTSGSGANLTTSGNIDFTQSFSSVPSGYAVKYTVCGATSGTQFVYDVRWNVTLLPSGKEELVVVGAQPAGSASADAWLNALPVSLRTVVGNDGS